MHFQKSKKERCHPELVEGYAGKAFTRLPFDKLRVTPTYNRNKASPIGKALSLNLNRKSKFVNRN